METIKQYLERRISELNKADTEFCKDRWDANKSSMERGLAREMSNQVTMARQELQAALKALNAIPEMKGKFVLLKGRTHNNVFWTTDDGSNHEADGFDILYYGNTSEEMIKEYEKYYP